MGVTRRIIFPTIRILLWAVIAAALVKIAFQGAELTTTDDALVPTAVITEQHAEVTTGTVTNAVAVQGSVIDDPSVPVKVTMAGTVTKVLATAGQHVEVGTPVLEVTLETPVEPTVATNPETGEQTVTENKPKIKKETIKASSAGTLTLTALKEQIVAVGDTVGSVAPGTLSVTGALSADQQYRLLGLPGEAQVTLKGGPAPFTCTGLRIGSSIPDTGTDATQVDTSPSTGGTVTCAVPAGITAFAGLGADIVITNGTAENVAVVPVTAVQGSVQDGNVWVVLPDGTNEERAVKLGLTDGENVQVTEGLSVGDQILLFVPVGDVTAECGDGTSGVDGVCPG
ncbi:secretion protein HlyD [Cellulomonas sp. P22]|uniref:secretion protein HlyD n=1 Tax=Cellulomonas sp. P22 TaxID=3373189 RepID=UPI0037911A64